MLKPTFYLYIFRELRFFMGKDRYTKEIEAFGAKIKSIRKSKGLTQLDLAMEMGVERSEISKIENGKSNIEFRTITKLAMALKVPLLELFNYKGDYLSNPKSNFT